MVSRALAILALCASCTSLREDFACTTDEQCTDQSGTPGFCESNGKCSTEDSSCGDGGRRYSEGAGDVAGECTETTDCVAEVRAGDNATCARRADGSVWCWGDGAVEPAVQDLPGGKAASIDLAGGRRCVRHVSGAVTCWVGDAPSAFPTSPNQGPVIGRDHGCAIGDGRAQCWGGNLRGQLGDGTFASRNTMPAYVTSLTGVAQIAAGDDTSCAVLGNGQVWCWGDDNRGQLGRGFIASEESNVPIQAGLINGNATLPLSSQVTVGTLFACAVTNINELYCWGLNDHAQLGFDGILDEEDAPQHVASSSNTAFVSAGGGHACALGVDKTLKCWGKNDAHQCAVAATTDVTSPTVVTDANGQPMHFTAVDTGGRHTCARSADDGAVYCWGANDRGQLGLGTMDSATRPTRTHLACP